MLEWKKKVTIQETEHLNAVILCSPELMHTNTHQGDKDSLADLMTF